MNGSVSTPTNAVNSSNTATSLCLKYLSTRYLSKCVEIAHSTGPENAKQAKTLATKHQLEDVAQNVMVKNVMANERRGTAPAKGLEEEPLNRSLPTEMADRKSPRSVSKPGSMKINV